MRDDSFAKPKPTISWSGGAPACSEIYDRAFAVIDPVVRKISFTGSTAVGKHLAAMAGST